MVLPDKSTTEQSVTKRSSVYNGMEDRWQLITDLMSGTKAMRDAGTKYLVQESREDNSDYERRLACAVLYEGYKETIKRLSGRPFTKPLTIEMPESLEYLRSDVDKSGKSFAQMAREYFELAINYGLCVALVDYTSIPKNAEGSVASIAEEKAAGARVVIRLIPITDILGYQTDYNSQDKQYLKQIRFKMRRLEADGQYGSKYVDYIKVMGVNTYEVWRKELVENREQYRMTESGSHSFGSIPIVPLYTAQTGFLQANPALEALAWMNLVHWQTYAEQRNALRFGRFCILFGKGLGKEAEQNGVTVGPSSLVTTEETEADLKYVEHTGKCIGAGQEDVDRTEKRMETLGMQPMIEKHVNETATGKAIDHGENISILQYWTKSLQEALTTILEYAAQWSNISGDISVEVFRDFKVQFYRNDEVKTLFEMCKAGKLQTKTLLEELQRRGYFGDDFDAETEANALASDEARMNNLLNTIMDDTEESNGEDTGDN